MRGILGVAFPRHGDNWIPMGHLCVIYRWDVPGFSPLFLSPSIFGIPNFKDNLLVLQGFTLDLPSIGRNHNKCGKYGISI